MYRSLPTRQKISETKIEGTYSKAVLHNFTLVVPCYITVIGRCSAADMGAIYSTQCTLKEGVKLGVVLNFGRNGQIGLKELHI